MRGIYVSTYDLRDETSGVCKKINSQLNVLRSADIEMMIFDANTVNGKRPRGIIGDLMGAIAGCSSPLMVELLSQIECYLKSSECNFIYIRKGLIDKKQLMHLRTIKKMYPTMKILVEIPTYPYDQEISWYKWPWTKNDYIARKHVHDCIDRVVTFSKDKRIFGVPTINIINGIDFEKIPCKKMGKHEGVHLLAVALFDQWHGYDRVLRGMVKDIDIVMNKNIHLHLVGNGRVLGEYKRFVEKNGIGEHVHFHGEKKNQELDKIYDLCDIGLDSMGRHRVGVYYNSTLKGKEYCAHGIPIISGVETELDSMPEFKYYRRIPADESAVSMREVMQFYDDVYGAANSDKIALTIRNQTKGVFSLQNTFKPVLEYLSADCMDQEGSLNECFDNSIKEI